MIIIRERKYASEYIGYSLKINENKDIIVQSSLFLYKSLFIYLISFDTARNWLKFTRENLKKLAENSKKRQKLLFFQTNGDCRVREIRLRLEGGARTNKH